MPNEEKNAASAREYDAVVVGGGASGAALLYALARYTDIPRLALVEKYDAVGAVNSNARNNSQTLHVGDIETNYSIEKAREVKSAAMMVKRYTDALAPQERERIIRRVQKMVLGVGEEETRFLTARHEALREIFPDLKLLKGPEIAQAEPEVMRGRGAEPVAALYSAEGYAVDYGALAASFADAASGGGRADILLETRVEGAKRDGAGYLLETNRGPIRARAVVFDTDAYSLGFAKRLGYGGHFSLIPIAGSFYFTEEKLRGKVYRVQDPRMPFAAVHGDPELTAPALTRWGPTARFYPALEARRLGTAPAFFRASGFHRAATWISFASILLDPVRFWYLFKNLLYDLPVVGRHFLLPQLRAIVPSIRARDIRRAPGYGGMRLQRVDTRTRELLLGEGKIVGENIIFNMTPSPGASVCLYNALRDAEAVAGFLPGRAFDKERMLADLCESRAMPVGDVSLRDTYAS